MRCSNCNQDSIYISKEEDKFYVKCDICGLKLLEQSDSIILQLLDYNIRLDFAYKEGKKAYEDGLEENNPYEAYSAYPVDPVELALNKQWSEGWDQEKIGYERTAFLSSSEKLNTAIDKAEKSIDKLNKEEKLYLDYIDITASSLAKMLKKRYWFGNGYSRDIRKMVQDLNEKIGVINPDS